jgi:ABC-2 type transport system ATP-binding protein
VSDHAVQIRELVKTYPSPDGGHFNAVDGLSLEVRSGEILAVLGPNGAGKTTTLEITEGLTAATSGRVSVLGLDVQQQLAEVKQRIGVQLQASSYFEYLALEEILALFGSFYERRRDPEELLARVGLADKRRALVGHLSGGQAQRFSIVAALVNDPDVLFLDEPTTGLDPQARRNLWDLVRAINDDGTTVVLTTHHMEEAECLADRVAIIDRGRLIALDSPGALVGDLAGRQRIRFTLPLGTHDVAHDTALATLPGVLDVQARRNGVAAYELTVDDPNDAVPELFRWAAANRALLQDVRIEAPTLEDVFLTRTGSRLRD